STTHRRSRRSAGQRHPALLAPAHILIFGSGRVSPSERRNSSSSTRGFFSGCQKLPSLDPDAFRQVSQSLAPGVLFIVATFYVFDSSQDAAPNRFRLLFGQIYDHIFGTRVG